MQQIIPKTMHFFWGEGGPMSWLRFMTLKSFCSLNPDWQVQLHICPSNGVTEKTWHGPQIQDYFTYTGKDYFPQVEDLPVQLRAWDIRDIPGKEELAESMRKNISAIHKSDMFTWDILSSEGGFYSDMDIIFVKPMEDYYEEVKHMDALMCHCPIARHFAIGFLGAKPGSPLYADVYAHCFAPAVTTSKGYQNTGVSALYSWGAISQGCRGRDIRGNALGYYRATYTRGAADPIEIGNIPMTVVYPFRWNQMGPLWYENRKDLVETLDSTGVHWYGGAACAQEKNNAMDGDTVHTMDNTVAHCARVFA